MKRYILEVTIAEELERPPKHGDCVMCVDFCIRNVDESTLRENPLLAQLLDEYQGKARRDNLAADVLEQSLKVH